MTFRVRLYDTVLIDRLATATKRIGEAADMIGGAAQAFGRATDPAKVRRARRSLASIGAVAWASLLGGLTRPEDRS